MGVLWASFTEKYWHKSTTETIQALLINVAKYQLLNSRMFVAFPRYMGEKEYLIHPKKLFPF